MDAIDIGFFIYFGIIAIVGFGFQLFEMVDEKNKNKGENENENLKNDREIF